MPLMITKIGITKVFEHGFKSLNLKMHLFSNGDVIQDSDNTITNYTEVNGGGYAPVQINSTDWTFANSTASCANKSFVFTGAVGDVYGYYITDESDNTLILSDYFNEKRTINYNGDTQIVNFTING